MKLEFSRKIFEKYQNIKFHENPSSGSRVVLCRQTDGHTDRYDEFILAINQLDAQKFCFTVSLSHASTCFEHHVLIIRSKFYYTASSIITQIDGRPVHRLR